MIEIRNLTKTFKKKKALNNINLKLYSGIYGLLGTNGAGKTTLIRCLTLLYPESKNTVYNNGILAYQDYDYLNKLGYLPQEFGLFRDLTVFDALLLLANFKGIEKTSAAEMINQCLRVTNLAEERDKKISSLSGGMLRRVGIAQALLNDPDLIIFDEPTAGLDPIERLRFKSIVSEIDKNKTVIISTHIVEDIESLCEKVIIMDSGEIKTCLSCDETRNIADGKVYEIPEEDAESLIGKIYIEKIYEHNQNKFARVLSSKKLNYPSCIPSVEDGYLCIIKGI